MAKIKSTYASVNGVQIRVLSDGRELSIETMETLKKMVKFAYLKTK